MRQISVIKQDNIYQVWDMAEKAPLVHFADQTLAANFAIKLRKAWGADDETYTKSFLGRLDHIPWSIEYSGEQYGWVIEDAEGRYIASVNTLTNAVAIRKAMGGDLPPVNDITQSVLGKFKPNGF